MAYHFPLDHPIVSHVFWLIIRFEVMLLFWYIFITLFCSSCVFFGAVTCDLPDAERETESWNLRQAREFQVRFASLCAAAVVFDPGRRKWQPRGPRAQLRGRATVMRNRYGGADCSLSISVNVSSWPLGAVPLITLPHGLWDCEMKKILSLHKGTMYHKPHAAIMIPHMANFSVPSASQSLFRHSGWADKSYVYTRKKKKDSSKLSEFIQINQLFVSLLWVANLHPGRWRISHCGTKAEIMLAVNRPSPQRCSGYVTNIYPLSHMGGTKHTLFALWFP